MKCQIAFKAIVQQLRAHTCTHLNSMNRPFLVVSLVHFSTRQFLSVYSVDANTISFSVTSHPFTPFLHRFYGFSSNSLNSQKTISKVGWLDIVQTFLLCLAVLCPVVAFVHSFIHSHLFRSFSLSLSLSMHMRFLLLVLLFHFI